MDRRKDFITYFKLNQQDINNLKIKLGTSLEEDINIRCLEDGIVENTKYAGQNNKNENLLNNDNSNGAISTIYNEFEVLQDNQSTSEHKANYYEDEFHDNTYSVDIIQKTESKEPIMVETFAGGNTIIENKSDKNEIIPIEKRKKIINKKILCITILVALIFAVIGISNISLGYEYVDISDGLPDTEAVSSTIDSSSPVVSQRNFSSKTQLNSSKAVNSSQVSSLQSTSSKMTSSSQNNSSQLVLSTANNVSEKTDEQRLKEAKELIPYYDTRWYVQQLSGKELENFCAMYKSCIEYNYKCTLPYPMDYDTIYNLIYYLEYDCPEIIIDLLGNWEYWDDEGKVYKVSFGGNNQSNLQSIAEKAEKKIDDLCINVKGESDFEKELFFFEYMWKNCVYDNNSDNCNSAYGALIECKATSRGISRAFKWAMDKLEVSSLCIEGENDKGNWFVWNSVKLNGVYYDLDNTPKNAAISVDYKLFNFKSNFYRSKYTLYDAVRVLDLPETNSLRGSYYYNTGMFIEDGQSAVDVLYSFLDQSYDNGDNTCTFQIENINVYNDFKQNIPTYFSEWKDNLDFEVYTTQITHSCTDEFQVVSITYSISN